VTLPPELEERLRAAAARSGQSVDEYLNKLLPPVNGGRPQGETPEERRARVYAIAGKYAHIPFSSEDLCRERHEEPQCEAERERRRASCGEPETARRSPLE
jgi:hypothetical protein